MKILILSIATLMSATLGSIAEDAPTNEAFVLKILLEAIQHNDLQKFGSVCDETMKAAMTAERLTLVSGQVSTLMKQGYKKDSMGVLNRGDIKTYYWKLDFDKDGVPDMLAELSIRDSKAAGFFLR